MSKPAYDWVEAHLWPNGPVCPRAVGLDRNTRLKGKSTRIGVYKCKDCRKPFTRDGRHHLRGQSISQCESGCRRSPCCAPSKKGISSNQLHRMLGVTLKTAWFMSHRIREAMRNGSLAPPMGGGGIVEADETFIGRKKDVPIGRSFHHKNAVLTLVDRSSGEARSFHVDKVDAFAVVPIVRQNVAREAAIVTDEAKHYSQLKKTTATTPSITDKRNGRAARSTPTPSRATSACSSAACVGCISIAQRSTCTAIWRSSTTATRTASPWALMTPNAPPAR